MLFYLFAMFYLTGITSVTAWATTKSASDRAVVAHFIFGNTYDHTRHDFQREFDLAAEIGIDAHVFNIAQDSWTTQQLDVAFGVAANSTTKIVFSFDFAVADWNTGSVISTLQRYSELPGYFRYQGSKGGGKGLVSTFDGHARFDVDWLAVKAAVPNIYVVPHLSIDEVKSGVPGINGALNWNAWPTRNNLPIDGNVTTVDDHIMQNALGHNQSYAAQVSPWSYTNFNAYGIIKEWVFPSQSDLLLTDRWQQMLGFAKSAQGAHIDIIQIYSWNDFGECNSINDITIAHPGEFSGGDDLYNKGFKHDGWRYVMPPFIKAFKSFATAVTTEHIQTEIVTFYFRPYLAKTLCSGQSRPITGSEFQHDMVAFIGQTKRPVQLVFTSGATSTVINFGAGLSTSRVPMQLGQQKLSATRNGKSCGQVTSSIVVTDTCTTPNYNANVEYILLNC
ncbi:glycoside hydrolase [Lactifluus volemus]|nr:glycoside hydrolase [Lactifluus volemus]